MTSYSLSFPFPQKSYSQGLQEFISQSDFLELLRDMWQSMLLILWDPYVGVQHFHQAQTRKQGLSKPEEPSGHQPTSNAKYNSSHEKDLWSLAKYWRLFQKRIKDLRKPGPITPWGQTPHLSSLQPWRMGAWGLDESREVSPESQRRRLRTCMPQHSGRNSHWTAGDSGKQVFPGFSA